MNWSQCQIHSIAHASCFPPHIVPEDRCHQFADGNWKILSLDHPINTVQVDPRSALFCSAVPGRYLVKLFPSIGKEIGSEVFRCRSAYQSLVSLCLKKVASWLHITHLWMSSSLPRFFCQSQFCFVFPSSFLLHFSLFPRLLQCYIVLLCWSGWLFVFSFSLSVRCLLFLEHYVLDAEQMCWWVLTL